MPPVSHGPLQEEVLPRVFKDWQVSHLMFEVGATRVRHIWGRMLGCVCISVIPTHVWSLPIQSSPNLSLEWKLAHAWHFLVPMLAMHASLPWHCPQLGSITALTRAVSCSHASAG